MENSSEGKLCMGGSIVVLYLVKMPVILCTLLYIVTTALLLHQISHLSSFQITWTEDS